LKELKK